MYLRMREPSLDSDPRVDRTESKPESHEFLGHTSTEHQFNLERKETPPQTPPPLNGNEVPLIGRDKP